MDHLDVNYLKIQEKNGQLTAFQLDSCMNMISEGEIRAVSDLLAFTNEQIEHLT